METEVHWTTDWLCPFLRGFMYADLLLIAKHFWYTHQMRKKPAAEFFLNSFFLFESGQFEHGLFTCTAPKSASTWRKELGQRWTPRGKPKSVHIYHTSDKGRLTASWKALIPFESIVMCRWILAWTHNWFFHLLLYNMLSVTSAISMVIQGFVSNCAYVLPKMQAF